MKCLDEIEYNAKNGQEIASLCMNCGAMKPTGKFTTIMFPDERYAISHGYCNDDCAKEHQEYLTLAQIINQRG